MSTTIGELAKEKRAKERKIFLKRILHYIGLYLLIISVIVLTLGTLSVFVGIAVFLFINGLWIGGLLYIIALLVAIALFLLAKDPTFDVLHPNF